MHFFPFSLSPQAHHAIGIFLTVYLLGFTGYYIQTVGVLLEQRDRPAPISREDINGATEGRSLPWRAAAAIVFPPIWTELFWFRRLWRRSPER